MLQLNNKLKRALQSVKDKIHRVAAERPDLFDDVSEDTIDRLDRLITTVENQATQVNALQTERNQADEEHQRQIREIQRYVRIDLDCQIRSLIIIIIVLWKHHSTSLRMNVG